MPRRQRPLETAVFKVTTLRKFQQFLLRKSNYYETYQQEQREFVFCLFFLDQNLMIAIVSLNLIFLNLVNIRQGPKIGFNFTLEGALLPGARFEPTSSRGH